MRTMNVLEVFRLRRKLKNDSYQNYVNALNSLNHHDIDAFMFSQTRHELGQLFYSENFCVIDRAILNCSQPTIKKIFETPIDFLTERIGHNNINAIAHAYSCDNDGTIGISLATNHVATTRLIRNNKSLLHEALKRDNAYTSATLINQCEMGLLATTIATLDPQEVIKQLKIIRGHVIRGHVDGDRLHVAMSVLQETISSANSTWLQIFKNQQDYMRVDRRAIFLSKCDENVLNEIMAAERKKSCNPLDGQSIESFINLQVPVVENLVSKITEEINKKNAEPKSVAEIICALAGIVNTKEENLILGVFGYPYLAYLISIASTGKYPHFDESVPGDAIAITYLQKYLT